MTTKITVEIKGGETILDAAKTVQANARAAYEEQKKQKEAEAEAKKATEQQQQSEDDEYKGGIREEEEEKEPENRPKSRKCGYWIFKDYIQGRPDYGTRIEPSVPEERVDLDYDLFQVSVGTSDGRKWATHVFEGPSGKPAAGQTVTGSQSFIGYLSYVQWYARGSGFGTTYTLPEGATVVPYDPEYYLMSPPAGTCPDGFCWGLFFPDELSSGPGRSRAMVTVTKTQKPVNAYEATTANQSIFNFPINNKKTIVIAANWLGWSMGDGGEVYNAIWPEQYFLHPQNYTQPSIRRTVYYKVPGGPETGWQPIYGFYWLMDPNDETIIMNLSRLGQVLPLNSSITHNYAGQSETELAGFIVGPNNVRKLDSIPDEVAAKIRARCPIPFWDDSNIYWARWNFRDVVDAIPGYPEDIANDYNNASWDMNPQAHCMGIAINMFYKWVADWNTGLPYDYWNRDEEFTIQYPDRGSVMSEQILGASPGIYDSYNLDLQDHAFYNHFGRGSWYDGNGYSYPVKESWTSEYGDVRIHTGDIREGAWKWMKEISTSNSNGGNPPWNITGNDLAWLYLRPEEREAFIDGYRRYDSVNIYDFTQDEIDYLYTAPEDPVFSYIFYERNIDAEKLIDGVKWISDGYTGAWTDANSPAFDYNDDPFYDVPYMDIDDPYWKKYKLQTKLSKQRTWPPSISAGFDDPIPADTPVSSKQSHPLARGGRHLSYVINTAWDNDYSQVLLVMGFSGGDLTP